MQILRNRSGAYFNAWTEGDTVYLQNVKTGRVTKPTRKSVRKNLRVSNDKKAAYKYANGEK